MCLTARSRLILNTRACLLLPIIGDPRKRGSPQSLSKFSFLLVIRVTADHYRFCQNLYLFMFLSGHFLCRRYLKNDDGNSLVTQQSYVPCHCLGMVILSMSQTIYDVIYDVKSQKLDLTYICNISSRPSNKTTKFGRGQVEVKGHLLDHTSCACASRRARKMQKCSKSLLIDSTIRFRSFGAFWCARVRARFFARTPFPSEYRRFFDGFGCLTEFYINQNPFPTNRTQNIAYKSKKRKCARMRAQ